MCGKFSFLDRETEEEKDEEAIVELRKLFNRTATSTRQLALTNLSNT